MNKDDHQDLPPFARSWPQLYALVIGALVVEIGLFYWLMTAFS